MLLIHVREKRIGFCRACYGCAQTGVCVQEDDFMDILHRAHEADGIIAEAPIYYNCMAAQMLTVINRLCCTFACKTYQNGPKKKVGIFLTCTGSEPEEMKRILEAHDRRAAGPTAPAKGLELVSYYFPILDELPESE